MPRTRSVLLILSLLACLTVAALWVRSYWAWDVAGRSTPQGRWVVISSRGRLFWLSGRYNVPQDFGPELLGFVQASSGFVTSRTGE